MESDPEDNSDVNAIDYGASDKALLTLAEIITAKNLSKRKSVKAQRRTRRLHAVTSIDDQMNDVVPDSEQSRFEEAAERACARSPEPQEPGCSNISGTLHSPISVPASPESTCETTKSDNLESNLISILNIPNASSTARTRVLDLRSPCAGNAPAERQPSTQIPVPMEISPRAVNAPAERQPSTQIPVPMEISPHSEPVPENRPAPSMNRALNQSPDTSTVNRGIVAEQNNNDNACQPGSTASQSDAYSSNENTTSVSSSSHPTNTISQANRSINQLNQAQPTASSFLTGFLRPPNPPRRGRKRAASTIFKPGAFGNQPRQNSRPYNTRQNQAQNTSFLQTGSFGITEGPGPIPPIPPNHQFNTRAQASILNQAQQPPERFLTPGGYSIDRSDTEAAINRFNTRAQAQQPSTNFLSPDQSFNDSLSRAMSTICNPGGYSNFESSDTNAVHRYNTRAQAQQPSTSYLPSGGFNNNERLDSEAIQRNNTRAQPQPSTSYLPSDQTNNYPLRRVMSTFCQPGTYSDNAGSDTEAAINRYNTRAQAQQPSTSFLPSGGFGNTERSDTAGVIHRYNTRAQAQQPSTSFIPSDQNNNDFVRRVMSTVCPPGTYSDNAGSDTEAAINRYNTRAQAQLPSTSFLPSGGFSNNERSDTAGVIHRYNTRAQAQQPSTSFIPSDQNNNDFVRRVMSTVCPPGTYSDNAGSDTEAAINRYNTRAQAQQPSTSFLPSGGFSNNERSDTAGVHRYNTRAQAQQPTTSFIPSDQNNNDFVRRVMSTVCPPGTYSDNAGSDTGAAINRYNTRAQAQQPSTSFLPSGGFGGSDTAGVHRYNTRAQAQQPSTSFIPSDQNNDFVRRVMSTVCPPGTYSDNAGSDTEAAINRYNTRAQAQQPSTSFLPSGGFSNNERSDTAGVHRYNTRAQAQQPSTSFIPSDQNNNDFVRRVMSTICRPGEYNTTQRSGREPIHRYNTRAHSQNVPSNPNPGSEYNYQQAQETRGDLPIQQVYVPPENNQQLWNMQNYGMGNNNPNQAAWDNFGIMAAAQNVHQPQMIRMPFRNFYADLLAVSSEPPPPLLPPLRVEMPPPPPPPLRPICEYCGKSFKNSKGLGMHKRRICERHLSFR